LHLIGDVLNHSKTTAGYAYFQTQQRRDALAGHGNQVLALTPPNLQECAVPEGISVDTLLTTTASALTTSGETDVPTHRHDFRREDLYHLVWTSPVSEVAARLGVSEVALAKLCRRAAIPLPGRGYWQKNRSGPTDWPAGFGSGA
jgi:hypothetical protein